MMRGQHGKHGKTKEIIIRYILNSSDGIEEKLLREYLDTNDNIIDSKTIKIHLEKLRQIGCIKKHKKAGFSNRWTIDKIDHIFKILENFPELSPDLRKSDTVINMLLQKHQPILREPDSQKYFRTFVGDSPQFFEAFLKHSSELLTRAATKLPNPNFSHPYVKNVDLKDNMILKIFCSSKVLDILYDTEVPTEQMSQN
jgi:hypothetical protein